MKVELTHSEPETNKDRQPYRVRIDGKDGQAIEIIEQMDGGFLIIAAGPGLVPKMSLHPMTSANTIIIKVSK